MISEKELAEKITNDILKALGKEEDPLSILIITYIETKLLEYKKSIKL
jgi:hypothetical protein